MLPDRWVEYKNSEQRFDCDVPVAVVGNTNTPNKPLVKYEKIVMDTEINTTRFMSRCSPLFSFSSENRWLSCHYSLIKTYRCKSERKLVATRMQTRISAAPRKSCFWTWQHLHRPPACPRRWFAIVIGILAATRTAARWIQVLRSCEAVKAEELKPVAVNCGSREKFRLTYEREQNEHALIEQGMAFFQENCEEHSRCIGHHNEIGWECAERIDDNYAFDCCWGFVAHPVSC